MLIYEYSYKEFAERENVNYYVLKRKRNRFVLNSTGD